MPIILNFRMLSDENDTFIRDYQLPYSITLFEMHKFICRDLGYDDSNMSSFFTSDKEWNKLAEFTSVDLGISNDDEGMPGTMSAVTLSQVVHNNNDRLIYQFDMLGERALYLELYSSAKGDITEGSVIYSSGNPPHQFDPSETLGSSIYDDIMSEFDDFAGDDNYDDDF